MPAYFPRVRAVLTVPVPADSADFDRDAHGADTVDIEIRVRRVEIERNDHLLADTCSLSVSYADLGGIDPRLLRNSRVRVWMGNGQPNEDYEPGADDLRFIGVCVSASRKTVEGGLAVEMTFHDFTALFLAQKPVSPAARPRFTDTLQDAWARLCDHVGYYDVDRGEIVSNVEALRDRLEATPGADLSAQLGRAVSDRIAKLGRVGTSPSDDAWTVWQRAVMSLGLISYLDRDKCIVTTSAELFGESDAPIFMYGHNMLECDERIDANHNAKGVMLYSYDHSSGRLIEAFYPPPGDPRVNANRKASFAMRRRGAKARSTATPNDLRTETYEPYEFHDIKDQATLDRLARRAYDERSRQEIQGYVRTAEFYAYSGPDFKEADPNKSPQFDLLDLGAGQNVSIVVDRTASELLAGAQTEEEGIQRLIDAMGYPETTARLLVRYAKIGGFSNPVMHTRRVSTVLEDTGDSIKFEVTVHYWNKIRVV